VADQEFYEGGSSLAKGREMTARLLSRSPDLDFLYYSNDMIGGGGLLELIEGLPRRLATMDACRRETGRRAAAIITRQALGEVAPDMEAESEGGATCEGDVVALEPRLQPGDTLKR